jgi:NO-binding membrane sensor protein with MHYT domain
MSFLRFLMLLSLMVWVGGLIFFPVLAQTAFSVLPTRHLAGSVVGRSLAALHWMGMASGVVFLVSSLLYRRISEGSAHPFAAGHLLVCLMLVLTLISQFGLIPSMDRIRASRGEIDSVPAADPARVRFDALHLWSTWLEGGVLFLGLVVAFLSSRSRP